MTALGPDLPKRGPSGSLVVTAELSAESGDQVYHYLPPSQPERDVYRYEDDEIIYVRTLSDDEYAAALKNWEAALAEWKRTGGTHISPGPTTFIVEVTCEDGSTAEAIGDGHKWRWTRCTLHNATEEQERAMRETFLR